MKKLLSFVIAGLVLVAVFSLLTVNHLNSADSLYKENFKALAETDSGYYGKCSGTGHRCEGPCPNCGVAIWAPDHLGELTITGGTCVICGHTVVSE